MTWTEPWWFLLGLFLVQYAGALLPIRVEEREDHIILTMSSGVTAGLLGPRALVILWGATLLAAPTRFVAGAIGWRGQRPPPRTTLRSVAWIVVTSVSCSVGYLVGNLFWAGALGRDYPITLGSQKDVILAGITAILAWIGTMGMRILSQRLIAGQFRVGALDPFDSILLPYLLPLLGGFPLITASIAMYRPDDPFGALVIMWWCIPLYIATHLDLKQRKMARELRRDAFARQRLAAIGEVSARIVHQSRHQVGLMGWSIHRLRNLIGASGPEAAEAMARELDALTEAKDRLSASLAAELLYEAGASGGDDDAGTDGMADAEGAATATAPPLTVAGVVADVVAQLAAEADDEGVVLRTDLRADAGEDAAPAAVRDVLFNLVDNAIDAARSEVVVTVDRSDVGPSITVLDDGPGLPESDRERAFEPFFTTKATGTGMGLAIADALMGDLGGDVHYERRGEHTAFVVTLPVVGRRR